MTGSFYISCKRWTCAVSVDARDGEEVVTEAPPLLRRYLGRPLREVLDYARRVGGLRVERKGQR